MASAYPCCVLTNLTMVAAESSASPISLHKLRMYVPPPTRTDMSKCGSSTFVSAMDVIVTGRACKSMSSAVTFSFLARS